MSIIQLNNFRQEKQRQYMKRYRAKLDLFVRARVPSHSADEIMYMAQNSMMQGAMAEMIWDYVEMRDIMLDFIEAHLAQEIYAELETQYWFDKAYITKDLIAEKCLSFMILGPTAAAQ